jgi:hypothetical protein
MSKWSSSILKLKSGVTNDNLHTEKLDGGIYIHLTCHQRIITPGEADRPTIHTKPYFMPTYIPNPITGERRMLLDTYIFALHHGYTTSLRKTAIIQLISTQITSFCLISLYKPPYL